MAAPLCTLASVPAPVLVLGAVASVQSGAAIATKLFPQVGPGGTVFLRLALSACFLLVLARPRFAARTRGEIGVAVTFGLVLAATNFTFYEALSRLPLGVAVTVEFIGPLGVAIAGSRRKLDFLWVALAAAGVVLLTSGGSGQIDLVGVLLAALAGGFWACYILLSQRVGRIFPGASGLTVALVVGGIATLPVGIVTAGTRLLHPVVVAKGAAVAVLSSALPYSLELFALRRMRASVFSVLMSLEPAMAALSGLVFLGQHLRAREWIAVGCVMVASIGATRESGREDVPAEPGATPTEAVPV